MDPSVKQMLAGFEQGLTAHLERLGESNETLKKAMEAYRKLTEHAESSDDMMAFYAKPEVASLMKDLSALLVDLSKEKPARGVRSVPAASAAAAGYHLAYDQIPKENEKTRAVYRRIFEIEKNSENALVFTRAMAEEGLYLKMSLVPMLEKQQGLVENAEKLSLPVMMNYHGRMIEKVAASRSIAELEYCAGLESEIAFYQNLWDTLLLNTTTTLLGNAIAGWLLTQSENERQEVENAYRFIAEFYGLDFDALYSVPRLRDHFDRIVFASVKEKIAQQGIDAPDALLETFRSVLEECMKGREPVVVGPKKNRTLELWGIETDINDVEKGYREHFYRRLL